MADKNLIVNHGHRVHLDPDHGLQLPRAEDLADRGVITASAVTVVTGESVKVPAADADALRAAGVVDSRK